MATLTLKPARVPTAALQDAHRDRAMRWGRHSPHTAGAKKRFKLRGDGVFVHARAGKKHLMAGSSRHRQTLRLREKKEVTTKGMIKRLRKLLPYGNNGNRLKRMWRNAGK